MNAAIETTKKKKTAAPQLDAVTQLMEQVSLLTKELAEIKQRTIASPAREKKESKKGQPREGVYYVVLSVPTKNFPPQAITCMKVLARAEDPTHVTEADAMRLIEESKNLLGTRQESWRIFCYYRAKLIGADYLKMI